MGNRPCYSYVKEPEDKEQLKALIKVCEFNPFSFPRFREVCLEHDVMEIVVRTRTGGIYNRDSYQKENIELTKYPHYLRNEDDSVDCTYAYWFYKMDPEKWKEWRSKFESSDEDEDINKNE